MRKKRVVIPIGELSKAQCLSRLAASPSSIPLGGKPKFYPAWREAQVLSRLAGSPGFIPLGGKPRFYPAWREAQVLSRLAGSQVLSRLAASPGSIPLSGKPRFYPAWREAQVLSRLAGSQVLSRLAGSQVLSRLAAVAKRGREVFYSTMTRPRLPSIFTRWPFVRRWQASRMPITAGMPSSRAVTAPCESGPPLSVMTPAAW